jgi:hypothetical protein
LVVVTLLLFWLLFLLCDIVEKDVPEMLLMLWLFLPWYGRVEEMVVGAVKVEAAGTYCGTFLYFVRLFLLQ